ncbi:unnamed protein product [Lactuca saligna]|uniref:Uncharacterized protein n=1 Tax=Lactuca saligna TaxID=75948 RepID=A0AA35V3S1_LACSI|nr:unnamed protein product [Lactuca saligna]
MGDMNLIKDFWRSAVVKKNNQGEKFIEEKIEEKKVQVSESIIRESLQIDDRSEYTMEIDIHQTQDVLEHIGAIAAFVAGFEFNFPKFIMHELILNLEGSKRDKFLMYPIFLHIIFNVIHTELRRCNETLDLKSIGPSAFGLMKQKRGGKFVFEGKFHLIKFGIFKECDRSESGEQSIPMESEDIVHSTSELEIKEGNVSPSVVMAEEHDHQKENETLSAQEDDDDDDDRYDDIEFLKEIDFTWISDDIPTNIEFDLDDEEFGPFLGIPSSCPNKVNEVASSATKTREEGNILKILLSTSKTLEVASSQGNVTSKIPPFVSSISTSDPMVPTVGSAPQVLSTITATTAYSPPKQSDEGLSTMFETGGSSSIPEYSPTRPSLDEASIREECTDDDKSSSFDLHEEIGILRQELIEKTIHMDQITCYIVELRTKIEEKTKQIKDVQMSLGSVTATYFNLKNILYDTFGDQVKALLQQPHGVDDPPTAPTQSVAKDFPVDPPAPRTTTIVNRIGKKLEGSRAGIMIKQGKITITANKSEGVLFMKNSNENRKAKDLV